MKFILVILISIQTLSACSSSTRINQNSRTANTLYAVSDSCIHCDITVVRETESKLEKLNYADLSRFLFTFSKDCSNNVEYSEYSNEVLFKVLEKYPSKFMDCMSKEKELDTKYIYSELSMPLLDINGKVIYKNVQSISGDKYTKEKILEALQKAIDYLK